MKLKFFYLIVTSLILSISLCAEELKIDNNNNNEFNIYTGMFDFSDDG